MANSNRNQQNYAGRSSQNNDNYEGNYNRLNRDENYDDYNDEYPQDTYRGQQENYEHQNYSGRKNSSQWINDRNTDNSDYDRGLNRGRSYGSGYLYSDQNQGSNRQMNERNDWQTNSPRSWDRDMSSRRENTDWRNRRDWENNDMRGRSEYGNTMSNYDRGYGEPRGYENRNDWGNMNQSDWRSNQNYTGRSSGEAGNRRNSGLDTTYGNQYGQNKEMGEHRGKGPKGYQRSDDRIKEDISDRLTDDSFLDASDIEIKVDNCDVILSGSVNSRNAKRHAESLAESISGVKNVENRLRVKQENENENTDRSSVSSSLLKSPDNSKSENHHTARRQTSLS